MVQVVVVVKMGVHVVKFIHALNVEAFVMIIDVLNSVSV